MDLNDKSESSKDTNQPEEIPSPNLNSDQEESTQPFIESESESLQSDVEIVNSFGRNYRSKMHKSDQRKAEFFALTQEQKAVIKVLQHFPSITKAASIAGVDVKKVYKWRQSSTKFLKASNAAMRIGFAFLEEIAIQRALEGSDYLLATVLKANNPKYKTKKQQKTVNNITINAAAQGAEALYSGLQETLKRNKLRITNEES